MSKHLWEIDHPYYCNESNYYQNGCSLDYDSWQEFLSEWNDSDLDLNLVFRWDWERYEVEDEDGEPTGEIRHTLKLFYMLQRKGAYRSNIVTVTEEDESAVREWLQVRWEHMQKLWAPFSIIEGGDTCPE